MKTYIRRQQHKNFFKHQDIKRKEPPQKYRLGTISNTKLLFVTVVGVCYFRVVQFKLVLVNRVIGNNNKIPGGRCPLIKSQKYDEKKINIGENGPIPEIGDSLPPFSSRSV